MKIKIWIISGNVNFGAFFPLFNRIIWSLSWVCKLTHLSKDLVNAKCCFAIIVCTMYAISLVHHVFQTTVKTACQRKKQLLEYIFQHSKIAPVVGKCRGFCWGISMFFIIFLSKKKKKKNAEAIEFLGILKKYFSKNKKNICIF